MKKAILFLLTLAVMMLASCEKEEFFTTPEMETSETTLPQDTDADDAINMEDHIVIEEEGTVSLRSARQLIYRRTVTLDQGRWFGIYATSAYLQPGYTYTAVLTPVSGNPDLHIYGYSPYRYIKGSRRTSGVDQAEVRKTDLRSGETRLYWYARAMTTTTFKLEVFKENSGGRDISLSGFRYVYQNRMPSDWRQDGKYTDNGYCDYPRYRGNYAMQNFSNTNLCGPASFLMALSMVPHDTRITVPSTDFDKAVRLAELAKRYKTFDSSYSLGGYTQIVKLEEMANGTSNKKGEFTSWANCGQYRNTATERLSTGNRTNIKNFIRTHISNDHPVIALISIKTRYGNADNTNYIATSGGAGHFVVITGITEDDATNTYLVRFKDPWANNGKTYEVNYTRFLNSMVDAPTYYNALAVVGQ